MQQVDDKKISFKVFQLVVPLLKSWRQENQIDGMHALNDDLIKKENEFSKRMEWVIVPKVIRRKRHVLGKMTVQVKTGLNAMKWHQGQNTMCNENNLKIMSKGTKMECTNKT